MRSVKTILLGEYSLRTPTETLMASRFDYIPNDVAALCGARFVHASESAENRKLNQSRLKDLTGGSDTVAARFLHAEFFQFKPECKIWLSTNHKPVIT